ncbi:hypothetical protein pdam_00009446 [Pocillopora damicornis]|uniref:Uncharacterized protein n=1 Tax=Pocillopora damicornis TaxID=46731 RepID=A0A3M6TGJ2_POCDA|nr:leucine-rich repeat-containing protein 58-like isoform X1 [Pocillopora damicornis]RMX40458.1 hypothetical protein pdam_00009446 [Pocillopora damicornis]
MDRILEPFRNIISFLFGRGLTSNPTKISLSDVDLTSEQEEDVGRILEAHKNPLKVQQFILEGKQICSIPIQLCSFSNLQKIILRGNQLTDISWSVIYLKQLKELDLSFNALERFPRIIAYIPTLEVLSVRGNYITYLPTELLNLPSLTSLDVRENPLTSPPPEIVEQGLQSILNYLKKRKGRRNLFCNFKPWFCEDKGPVIAEVSTLFELSIKCILDCHIDFLSAGHLPPRLKSNLEENRKEEQSSIFICKCNVCKKYFSNKFRFEIHDCSVVQ